MEQQQKIALSPSKLSILADCPRCFWLQHRASVARPEGIFPSLPNGMDAVLKKAMGENVNREAMAKALGDLDSLPVDKALVKGWQNWRTGLQCELTVDGGKGPWLVILSGALDDCIVVNGLYRPVDYKTRGWAPKDSGEQYYGSQMALYAFMLRENGYEPTGDAVLLYFWPVEVRDAFFSGGGSIQFNAEPYVIPADPERGREIVENAVAVLAGPIPDASAECVYCRQHERRAAAEAIIKSEEEIPDGGDELFGK